MIKVNGEPIPEAAIQFELKRLIRFYTAHLSADQMREQIETLRRKAKDQAVGAKLLIAEAERLDIQVSNAEIEEKIAEMAAQSGGREALTRKLSSQGLGLEALRQSVERGRKVDKLVDKIAAGTREPNDEEVRAHFEAHRREYTKPDEAEAQHILIKPASDGDSDRQTARSRLNEIRARILEGADFADQAAAHSDCPSGKRTGGSLGWISRGAMVEAFDRAVFSLEVQKLSEIVESPIGYHLVRVTAVRPGGPAELDEVREKIRDFLRHVKRGEAIAAHVEELKQQAVIEEA